MENGNETRTEEIGDVITVRQIRRGLLERLFDWATSWGIILTCMVLIAWWLMEYGQINPKPINQFISMKLPGILFNLGFLYGPLWIFDQITCGETIALINNDKWTATVFWCVMAWVTRDLLLYA